MREKEWPFRPTDPEWQSLLRFDEQYHKSEPYLRYVSKTGLFYGLRDLASPKNSVVIFYCLSDKLPDGASIPDEFEGIPVDFYGFMGAD